jgi:hypothetical protein
MSCIRRHDISSMDLNAMSCNSHGHFRTTEIRNRMAVVYTIDSTRKMTKHVRGKASKTIL